MDLELDFETCLALSLLGVISVYFIYQWCKPQLTLDEMREIVLADPQKKAHYFEEIRKNGIEEGYPMCCIDAFIERKVQYVPCEKCAIKILEEMNKVRE
jgi:hypothetical protein